MASSNEYLLYALDLLREVNNVTYKKMMGEYLLYSDSILFGGVYDNRFLVKKTKSALSYELAEAIPYPGAKPMLVIDIENTSEVKEIVEGILADLRK